MNSETTAVATDLKGLEGLSFDDLLLFLERALQGEESLPMVTPNESPELPILRRERELNTMTREDLCTACMTLVRRYVQEPAGQEDIYVAALMRLAKGFGLKELVTDLHRLATCEEVFLKLPDAQMKAVLFCLIDLRAALPDAFWIDMTAALPEALKGLAVSPLLRAGPQAVCQILPLLPDNEGVADDLYTKLKQHQKDLSPEALQTLARAVREIQPNCKQSIKDSLDDWFDLIEPDVPAMVLGLTNGRNTKLDVALFEFRKARGEFYEPHPTSARLSNSDQELDRELDLAS